MHVKRHAWQAQIQSSRTDNQHNDRGYLLKPKSSHIRKFAYVSDYLKTLSTSKYVLLCHCK